MWKFFFTSFRDFYWKEFGHQLGTGRWNKPHVKLVINSPKSFDLQYGYQILQRVQFFFNMLFPI